MVAVVHLCRRTSGPGGNRYRDGPGIMKKVTCPTNHCKLGSNVFSISSCR